MKPNRTKVEPIVLEKPSLAKLTLVGDAATLKSIDVTGWTATDDHESYNVTLSIDTPITTACKFPLDDLVRQIAQRSESEEKTEKRTTKVQLTRKYENLLVKAEDIVRKKTFSFQAEIVGAPSVTILDGDTSIRIRCKTTLKKDDFDCAVRMLNNQRTFAFTPMQSELFEGE